MLRMNKLTDYALVLLLELNTSVVLSARHLSQKTKIPLATTNKILKILLQANLCESKSGKNGGFILTKEKNHISILNVLNATEENKTHLTDCISHDKICQFHTHCKISKKIRKVDEAISNVLNSYFLSDFE